MRLRHRQDPRIRGFTQYIPSFPFPMNIQSEDAENRKDRCLFIPFEKLFKLF